MFAVRYPHQRVAYTYNWKEYVTFDKAVEVGRDAIRGRYSWFEVYNVDFINGKKIYKLFVRVYN